MLINSEDGKAKVTLCVELGDAHHLPAPSYQRTRNEPARQRRRHRRELAHNSAKAEEATSTVVVENLGAEEAENVVRFDAEKVIDEQTENENSSENFIAGKANVEANMKVSDEVCSDEVYDKKAPVAKELSDCDISRHD